MSFVKGKTAARASGAARSSGAGSASSDGRSHPPPPAPMGRALAARSENGRFQRRPEAAASGGARPAAAAAAPPVAAPPVSKRWRAGGKPIPLPDGPFSGDLEAEHLFGGNSSASSLAPPERAVPERAGMPERAVPERAEPARFPDAQRAQNFEEAVMRAVARVAEAERARSRSPRKILVTTITSLWASDGQVETTAKTEKFE